jgi:hypothetical protein
MRLRVLDHFQHTVLSQLLPQLLLLLLLLLLL